MNNLLNQLHKLRLPKTMVIAIMNRAKKLGTAKILLNPDNSIEFVEKYYKEYNKGINGRYYMTRIDNVNWLNLNYEHGGKQVIDLRN